MWSWLVFMRHDVEKRRWFGVPLPKPNLKVGFEEQATTFINGVADKVFAARVLTTRARIRAVQSGSGRFASCATAMSFR